MTETQLYKELQFLYDEIYMILAKRDIRESDLKKLEDLNFKYLNEANTLTGVSKLNLEANLRQFSRGKMIALMDELNTTDDILDVKKFESKMNKYNQDWLSTENQIVKRQVNASKELVNYQKLKNKGYVIEWVTSRDEKVRDSHKAMDGFRAAPDDPFWTNNMPGTAPNCRCTHKLIKGYPSKRNPDPEISKISNDLDIQNPLSNGGTIFGDENNFIKLGK